MSRATDSHLLSSNLHQKILHISNHLSSNSSSHQVLTPIIYSSNQCNSNPFSNNNHLSLAQILLINNSSHHINNHTNSHLLIKHTLNSNNNPTSSQSQLLKSKHSSSSLHLNLQLKIHL